MFNKSLYFLLLNFFSEKMLRKLYFSLSKNFSNALKRKSFIQDIRNVANKHKYAASWPSLLLIESFKNDSSWPERSKRYHDNVINTELKLLEIAKNLVLTRDREKFGAKIKDYVVVPIIRLVLKPNVESEFLKYLQKSFKPFFTLSYCLPEKPGPLACFLYLIISFWVSLVLIFFPEPEWGEGVKNKISLSAK